MDQFSREILARRLIFPDPDLLNELVDLYFSNVNILMPVLHRPTFEGDVRTGLHLRHPIFGCVVLLVCALGSRFCRDPRVILPGDKGSLSSGWRWFSQTRGLDDASLISPSSHLHLLQSICVRDIPLLSTVARSYELILAGHGICLPYFS